MPCKSWGFSVWLMGTGSITKLCQYRTFTSNPFWWFFPRPQVTFPMHVLTSVLPSIWERSSADIQSFLSRQLASLWYSILSILATLVFTGAQHFFFNWGSLLDSTWVLILCAITWRPAQGSRIVEPTPFAFHLSGITVLHCLMPASWKLFFHILDLFFGSFRWKSKSNYCFSILARSRVQRKFWGIVLSLDRSLYK